MGGVSKPDLLVRLAQRSVSLNEYARLLFADDGFTTSDEAREVRLAVVSLPDLGLPQGGMFAEIMERAVSLGLEPCELEVAPHLRLHRLDQPEGPYLTVASPEPQPNTTFPNGIYLRRLEGQLWLRGYESGPESIYAHDFTDFVFSYPER